MTTPTEAGADGINPELLRLLRGEAAAGTSETFCCALAVQEILHGLGDVLRDSRTVVDAAYRWLTDQAAGRSLVLVDPEGTSGTRDPVVAMATVAMLLRTTDDGLTALTSLLGDVERRVGVLRSVTIHDQR